ncbi:hypothetical protein niasHT_038922 [Heterodera trifolii]|uniref:Uncharacterized protein n=1 Tax=Heterodera trifolii TaxID=157864 RepID=A0ABD2ISB5_9BILA
MAKNSKPESGGENGRQHHSLDVFYRFFQPLHDARGGRRLVTTPVTSIFHDNRAPILCSGKNSNNCDSAGEASRSRKRDRVDLLHEVEMDKIREEKRHRRQRRKNEEVQRQRALLRLRTDYRNARCAVATGQYRISCTGTTTFVAIPQIGQSHGQPAMPFTLAFSYEPALPIEVTTDLFGQSFAGGHGGGDLARMNIAPGKVLSNYIVGGPIRANAGASNVRPICTESGGGGGSVPTRTNACASNVRPIYRESGRDGGGGVPTERMSAPQMFGRFALSLVAVVVVVCLLERMSAPQMFGRFVLSLVAVVVVVCLLERMSSPQMFGRFTLSLMAVVVLLNRIILARMLASELCDRILLL